MRLLLDTHVFLWFISADVRLANAAREAIENPTNEVFLSIISLWETIVKHQLGKLWLPEPPEVYLPQQRVRHQIETLDLDETSVAQLARLPALHRDPFDRMLVCQALQHGLTLVTGDEILHSYPVICLKA